MTWTGWLADGLVFLAYLILGYTGVRAELGRRRKLRAARDHVPLPIQMYPPPSGNPAPMSALVQMTYTNPRSGR